MGLPVDADTADSDAPSAASDALAGGETCASASDAEHASDQSSDDEALADDVLMGVKVLPLFTLAPSLCA